MGTRNNIPGTSAFGSLWAGGLALIVLLGCEQKPAAAPAKPAETNHQSTLAAPATAAPAAPPAWTPPAIPPGAETPPVRPRGAPTGTFVDRAADADFRLVSYNVLWNSIFVEVNPVNAARFVRVMRALDPDIVALQEIGVTSWMRAQNPDVREWSEQDVVHVLNAILPLEGGGSWHAHRAFDNVIVSRWPLSLMRTDTEPPGERVQAIALVDLPDERFVIDFYVFNNHYKCCGGEENDPRRQQQSDAIIAWIRDARTPGGHLDLPAHTGLAVVGDLNIVGGFQPVQTLLDGDIQNEARYGADFAPDWDDSALTDLHPRHNGDGTDDYTWRNDNDQWDPGRLDFIIYSDSVLEARHSFVLNTTTMSDEDLAAAGLERLDVTVDATGAEFDHLPLVVDFRVTVERAPS